MMRSSVDLPQPDGPTKMTNSPSSTSRSMPFSTSMRAEGLADGFECEAIPRVFSLSQSLTGWPVRTLSSAARQMRSDCTASSMWRSRSMSSRIALSTIGLLAIAELLVAGLAVHLSASWSGSDELAVGAGLGRVQADDRGLGVGVDVVGLGVRIHDDRDRSRSATSRPSRRRRSPRSSAPSRPRTSRPSRRRTAPGGGRNCTCRRRSRRTAAGPCRAPRPALASVIWHITST